MLLSVHVCHDIAILSALHQVMPSVASPSVLVSSLSAQHGVVPSVVSPSVLGAELGPDMLCSPWISHSWKCILHGRNI